MDVSKPITIRTLEDEKNFKTNYEKIFEKPRRKKEVIKPKTHRDIINEMYMESLNCGPSWIKEFVEKVIKYIEENEKKK